LWPASGTDLKAEFVMRTTAFLTLGQYLFRTDHSGVGAAHAEPHVPDYTVEYLNRLMIRMIAGELAGKRLLPSDIIDRGGDRAQESRSVQSIDLRQARQRSPKAATTISTMAVPHWVWLSIALVCWFAVEAAIERRREPQRARPLVDEPMGQPVGHVLTNDALVGR
jgi:hypothetical protein